jgi:tripartite-type tricarboxylate transporter receptor subunit TctC
MITHRILTVLTFAIAAIVNTNIASAADYPVRPVRLVIGSAVGGPLDVPARWIALKLTDVLGKPVVLDNRGGAAGNIAYEIVAKSPADGYTLLYITNAFVLSSITASNLPFDPIRDFASIARVASAPTLLVASKELGITNVKDLVAFAKKNPGKLTFGSQGTGGTQHLYGEMLKSMAGIDMLHVPYKGGNLAINDLMAGRLDLIFYSAAGALPLIKAGKIVVLGNSSKERSQFMPEIPTIDEQGVKGFDGGARHGIVAPAHTPPQVIRILHDALAKVLAMPDTKKAFADAGLEPTISTPAELDAWLKSQNQRWRQVINAAHIQVN